MTTSVLRAMLVVAIALLGIFGLSRMFSPDGDQTTTDGAPGPTGPSPTAPAPEEPSPEEPPQDQEQPPQEARQEGVVIDVLNGTDEAGLADATSSELEELGYEIRQIGNAATNYDETTIFFRQGARPEAQHLADLFFDGNASLDRMQDDAQSDAELIVVLGFDYANG